MFIGSVLSYHSVSSWNAIYPLQCQDHALCPCPCPSLLVPVPCSSDLLVPGHQVRTVLLLETTCSPSFTEKVRGAVCGVWRAYTWTQSSHKLQGSGGGRGEKHLIVGCISLYKIFSPHGNISSSATWCCYFFSSFMVPRWKVCMGHWVSSPQLCPNWLNENCSRLVKLPWLHLSLLPLGSIYRPTCKLWETWDPTHLTDTVCWSSKWRRLYYFSR